MGEARSLQALNPILHVWLPHGKALVTGGLVKRAYRSRRDDQKRIELLLIDMQWGVIDERSSFCIAGARASTC